MDMHLCIHKNTRLVSEHALTFVSEFLYMNNKSVNSRTAGLASQTLRNTSVRKLQMAECVKALTFSFKYEFPFSLLCFGLIS